MPVCAVSYWPEGPYAQARLDRYLLGEWPLPASEQMKQLTGLMATGGAPRLAVA